VAQVGGWVTQFVSVTQFGFVTQFGSVTQFGFVTQFETQVDAEHRGKGAYNVAVPDVTET